MSTAHMIIETSTPMGAILLPIAHLIQLELTFLFAAGDFLELSFLRSALHGGSSCQISISPGRYPNKNSALEVIHSIQGGCPANVNGNLEPENSKGRDAA
ncbi:hypothetical protein EMCG_08586 [[Emmonsia] crescens]|uniref:Uncharacterized protein n=1 Tax=[Emmonsia] crescens TaxID=73230 RepID=A0A0G2I5R5_9EURO|nr:hypothetical protein EMCG_08586 [Emmonsia crescens UAMH 3008]